MNSKRKSRLYLAAFLLVAIAAHRSADDGAGTEHQHVFIAVDIVSGVAPADTQIRAGGMVADESVQRDPDSLAVSFVITDHLGADFTVTYTGILPDLFREGQGIIVQGKLGADGVFAANEVLAATMKTTCRRS